MGHGKSTLSPPAGEHRARVRVGDPTGLHARPCAALAKLVRDARGTDLRVISRGREVDGGSIMEMLSLVIGGGEEVELVATGAGAPALLAAASRVIAQPGA